jgi:hypothetical protein
MSSNTNNLSPAEALRQKARFLLKQELDKWDRVELDLKDGSVADFMEIDFILDKLVPVVTAYAATVEREAASRELKQLVADTLTPENVGGHFIHDEVKEFAKQQREFIERRLAALQGPREGEE